MKKSLKIGIWAAAVLILAAAVSCWMLLRQNTAVTVDGISYYVTGSVLDLRDREITPEHYGKLQKALPDCRILWNVPFQKRHYASDTEAITVVSLTAEDVENLRYLTKLTHVDASNCFDYEAIRLLREQKPDCQVDYFVEIDGKILPPDTEELNFPEGRGSFRELVEKLAYLPDMKRVYFEKPEMTSEQLVQLQDTYPRIEFSWTKELFGTVLSSEQTDLDLSGMQFESVAQIEEQTEFLPNLQKLIMCDTGLPYEQIAAFRERSREKFQVVFNVIVKNLDVRTDIRRFVPAELGVVVSDCDTRYLVYCEDLLYVDLSGSVVRNIDWARGTPHLQGLILRDSPFRDLQPLRNLKELKLLELTRLDIRDARPLLSCTALEDLKITGVVPGMEILGQMSGLENLWVSGGKKELQSLLPGTAVHSEREKGWEDLPNYRAMQQLADPNVPRILENPPQKKITPGFVIPKI